MSKRTIDPILWSHPDYQDLGGAGKLLVLYLMTSNESHVSGLMTLDRKVALRVAFNDHEELLMNALDQLKKSPIAIVDEDSAENVLIFIPIYLDINKYLNGPTNTRQIIAKIEEHADSITSALLYYKFRKECTKQEKNKLAQSFFASFPKRDGAERWLSVQQQIESVGSVIKYIEKHHERNANEADGEVGEIKRAEHDRNRFLEAARLKAEREMRTEVEWVDEQDQGDSEDFDA